MLARFPPELGDIARSVSLHRYPAMPNIVVRGCTVGNRDSGHVVLWAMSFQITSFGFEAPK